MAAGGTHREPGRAGPRPLRERATMASYRALLADRNYRLWFFAALITSLGDWAGLFALQILVTAITEGSRAELFSLGGIMMARLVPSVLIGPVAGVLADRYQRRYLMVIVDVARGALFCVMAFSGDLVAIFALTFAIETLALLFMSAKDAMLPSLVPRQRLTQANQLNFLVTYGPLPFGAALAAGLVTLASLLPETALTAEPVRAVLLLDGLTFFISALLVRGIRAPADVDRAAERSADGNALATEAAVGGAAVDSAAAGGAAAGGAAAGAGASAGAGVYKEVREGLRAIADQPLVYALVTGVTGVFFGAAIVVTIGPVFVARTLGRPEDDWLTMVTFVGAGLILGILAVPLATNRFRIERVYPVGLVVTSVVATLLAINSEWEIALGLGATLGAAAGMTVVTGYTLLHAYTADESRGRTFASFYAATRVAMFTALGLAPFLAGSIEVINIGVSGTGNADAQLTFSGARITMLLGGLVALYFAQRSARALWSVAGVDDDIAEHAPTAAGWLIAFEGVEGAGKSTQAAKLVEHLEARGFEVVRTREPGGTPVAEAVREVLLDDRLDAMGDRTEALLYAAARAEHVAKVIAPALERGAVVVTDRFLDSSLAYQGHARGLGIDEVMSINEWATKHTTADIVVLLQLPVADGMDRVRKRVGGDGRGDRLEQEAIAFHERVAEGFAELAARSPDRFVIVDARGDADDIATRIREQVDGRLPADAAQPAPAREADARSEA